MTPAEDIAVAAYRSKAQASDLDTFRVAWKESDLHVASRGDHRDEALSVLRRERSLLEDYIAARPLFLKALSPVEVHERAPPVVRDMAQAALLAGVGPMAAVAGALAERVGRHLLARTDEVIVENGGDVFACIARERVLALDAGNSPFSWRLGIKVTPAMGPLGVCTSSGTRGGSMSFGRADAACAIASSAALADAAATAIGNAVTTAADIDAGLSVAKNIPGLAGAVIVVGDSIGAWGRIELVEIK